MHSKIIERWHTVFELVLHVPPAQPACTCKRGNVERLRLLYNIRSLVISYECPPLPRPRSPPRRISTAHSQEYLYSNATLSYHFNRRWNFQDFGSTFLAWAAQKIMGEEGNDELHIPLYAKTQEPK